MKINQQVTNLELSKRLKSLGVKQESIFWWREGLTIEIATSHAKYEDKYISGAICSAFTVAELGEMLQESDCELPWFFKHEETYPDGAWHWSTMSEDSIEMNEADARAAMLIYLLENKLLDNRSIEI